jgi:RHS repeat-associated protein
VRGITNDERGNTLKDTNAGFIPFGFAGGVVDRDTGLIRFGARDYDPQTGRWTEKDAIGFKGGLNFYSYAGGDAVNRVDPSGHFISIAVGVALGAGADLTWQLINNGGNLGCVSWGEVALAGVAGGLLGAGVGALLPEAGEGLTVIGRFPAYTDLAAQLGANVFEVPIADWNAMTAAEQWAANQAFLDNAIANGDTFVLASPLSAATPTSYFFQEIGYILDNGYTLSADASALIPK